MLVAGVDELELLVLKEKVEGLDVEGFMMQGREKGCVSKELKGRDLSQ